MHFIYNNIDYEMQLCTMQGAATVRYFDSLLHHLLAQFFTLRGRLMLAIKLPSTSTMQLVFEAVHHKLLLNSDS
jgi:hypothetical protein